MEEKPCSACGQFECELKIHLQTRQAWFDHQLHLGHTPGNVDLESELVENTTLFHHAASAGSIEGANFALSYGESVDGRAYSKAEYQVAQADWTPLMFAISSGQLRMVRWLLEHGASQFRSRAGEWPIELAIRKGIEETFWLLVEFGFSRVSDDLFHDSMSLYWRPRERDRPEHVWADARRTGYARRYFAGLHPGLRNDYIKHSIEAVARRKPPQDLCHKMASLKPSQIGDAGYALINAHEQSLWSHFTQVFLLSIEGLDSTQDFCRSCRVGLENDDLFTRQSWMLRLDQLELWARHKKVFSYGFLPRCLFCRQCLFELPVLRPELRCGVILPSRTKSFFQVRQLNEEGWLSLLRRTVVSLTSSIEDLSYLCEVRRRLRTDNFEELLLLPRYWLTRCLKGHEACSLGATRGSEEPLLPNRVIVLVEDAPYIWETSAGSPRAPYCTLSYRWTPEAITLRRSNLHSFCTNLPVHTLPATIQQAMALARRLAFRYMWIDALCIVQDDSSDWEHEAALMGQIYMNSVLTIAVIDGTDDNGTRSLLGYEQTRPATHHFDAPVDPDAPPATWFRPTGILDKRGWFLQEQILSRRVLSFSKAGIFWDCCLWNCSEAMPGGIRAPTESAWRGSPYFESTYIPTPWYRTPDLHKWAVKADLVMGLELWHRILENYTRRDLSYATDRLVAIKGIATYFQTACSVTIMVGMWMPNFLGELLWKPAESARPKELDVPKRRHGAREWASAHLPSRLKKAIKASQPVKSHVLPSWSWGGLDGAIDWTNADQPVADYVEIARHYIEEHGQGTFSAEIILHGTIIPLYIASDRHVYFASFDSASREPFSGETCDSSAFLRSEGEQRPERGEAYYSKTQTIFESDENWDQAALCVALFMGRYSLCLQRQPSESYHRIGLVRWSSVIITTLQKRLERGDRLINPNDDCEPEPITFKHATSDLEASQQSASASLTIWTKWTRLSIE